MQTSLFNDLKPLYYCIYCDWIGETYVEEKVKGYFTERDFKDGHPQTIELCPKCHWVVYTEEEAKGCMSVYPKLQQKLNKKGK